MDKTFKARIDRIICEKPSFFDVELSIKGVNSDYIKEFLSLQGRNIFINVKLAEGKLESY